MSELESHVFTEIEIDATADQVWAVLTDFEKLPEWSSSFKGLTNPWLWVRCRPPISKTQSQAG